MKGERTYSLGLEKHQNIEEFLPQRRKIRRRKEKIKKNLRFSLTFSPLRSFFSSKWFAVEGILAHKK
ncbi:MAG: hypothetical protein LBP76_03090 [Treponema sp.]|jgi:hypothetical protein|nr:hypothetical protein [Treponema sp.]